MKLSVALFLGVISLSEAINLNYAYGDYEKERDSVAGYPSIENVGNHKAYASQYLDSKTGRFKTPFEVEMEKAEQMQKNLEAAAQVKRFVVPDNMLNDWTGNRFMTHPYGVASGLAQRSQPNIGVRFYPGYGLSQLRARSRHEKEEKDEKEKKEEKKETPEELDAANAKAAEAIKDAGEKGKQEGRAEEIKKADAEIAEDEAKKLASNGGVPPELGGIPSELPKGEKKPEPKQAAPKEDSTTPPEIEAALKEAAPAPEVISPTAIHLRLGDLQEHRYRYAPAMEPNALTPEEQAGMDHIDSAHNLIYDHFDADTRKFVHPDQKDMEAAEAAEARLIREGPMKIYEVPDSVMDDWTGSRFMVNWKCYGKEPCEKNDKE